MLTKRNQTGLEYVVIIGGIIIFSAASYFMIKSFSETGSNGTTGEMESVFDIFTSELGEIAGEAGPVILFSGPLNMNGSGIYNVSEIEVDTVNTSQISVHTNALIESIGGSPLILRSALYMLVEAIGNLILNPSGNVGIKTSSPSTELDVNGTVTADNAVFDNANNVTNALKVGDDSDYVTIWNEGEGIYKATYNFKDEVVGTTGTAVGFVDSVSTAGNTIIVSEVGNHKKVLKQSNVGSVDSLWHTFPGGHENAGMREFWVQASETDKTITIALREDNTNRIVMEFTNGGGISYKDNDSWIGLATYTANTWHHIKVHWYSNDTLDLWIDGKKEVTGGNFTKTMTSGINQFFIGTYNTSFYFDAWGDPADPNYEEGDNWLHGKIIKADSLKIENYTVNDPHSLIKYHYTIPVFVQDAGNPVSTTYTDGTTFQNVGELIVWGRSFVSNVIGEVPTGMKRRYKFTYVFTNDVQGSAGTDDLKNQWRIIDTSNGDSEVVPTTNLQRLWASTGYRYTTSSDWIDSLSTGHLRLQVLVREGDYARNEWSWGLYILVEDYYE